MAEDQYYRMNIDAFLDPKAERGKPASVIGDDHRFYNPAKPIPREIWPEKDLLDHFPRQLSVMLQPATIPNNEYPALLVFPELVHPRDKPATSTAPGTISRPSPTSANSLLAGFTPRWVEPPKGEKAYQEKEAIMRQIADECHSIYTSRQASHDFEARRKEVREAGLYSTFNPPPQFVPHTPGGSQTTPTNARSNVHTLEFNILYTEHTATLRMNAQEAAHTKISDLFHRKGSDISAFFKSHNLPPLESLNVYLSPHARPTSMVGEWAGLTNAAIVFYPKDEPNTTFLRRTQTLPALLSSVRAILRKANFQLKTLQTLARLVQQQQLAIAARQRWREWDQFDQAPNSFYRLLRRAMLAAEQNTAELHSRLEKPCCSLQRHAARAGRTPAGHILATRNHLIRLQEQERASSSAMLGRGLPHRREAIAELQAEVRDAERRLQLRIVPMFQIWGRAFIPYIRRRIADFLPLDEAVRVHRNTYGFPENESSWNSVLESIRTRPHLMERFQQVGMDWLALKHTTAWGIDAHAEGSQEIQDPRPAKARRLYEEGTTMCHQGVTPAHEAAAITSSALKDFWIRLEKIFRVVHGKQVDIRVLAANFFDSSSVPTHSRALLPQLPPSQQQQPPSSQQQQQPPPSQQQQPAPPQQQKQPPSQQQKPPTSQQQQQPSSRWQQQQQPPQQQQQGFQKPQDEEHRKRKRGSRGSRKGGRRNQEPQDQQSSGRWMDDQEPSPQAQPDQPNLPPREARGSKARDKRSRRW